MNQATLELKPWLSSNAHSHASVYYSLFLSRLTCTISVSAREGRMLRRGPQSSSRKVLWVEEHSVKGWGCSECAGVFHPSGPPTGESLDVTETES